MADKRKKLKTKKMADGTQLFLSPRAKAVSASTKNKKFGASEAANKLLPKGASKQMRSSVAKAMGSQDAERFASSARVKASTRRAKKTQTRKPGMKRK